MFTWNYFTKLQELRRAILVKMYKTMSCKDGPWVGMSGTDGFEGAGLVAMDI